MADHVIEVHRTDGHRAVVFETYDAADADRFTEKCTDPRRGWRAEPRRDEPEGGHR